MLPTVHFVLLVPCILHGLVHLLVNELNCPQCSFVRQFFRNRAAGSPKSTSLCLSNTLIYHIIKNKLGVIKIKLLKLF